MNNNLHRLLIRQLHKLNLDKQDLPCPQAWSEFLCAVDQSYRDADQDRYTLERSLSLSSEELQALYRRQKASYESRLRGVFNSIQDLIWLKDPDGLYLACNLMFERFFGASESAIIGKTDYDFVDKNLADFFRANDQLAIKAGKSTVNEEWVKFADDGHHAYLETVKTPMWNDAGELLGVLGISRDITARKQQEILMNARLTLIDLSIRFDYQYLMQVTLDKAEELTGSNIGFFHLVNDDQDTISLQDWSSNTIKNMCKAEGIGRHYPISEAGVWADAIRTRQPVLCNDYPGLPNKKFIPDDHAHIERFITHPVLRKGKAIALIGVGNKNSGYNDTDLQLLSQLTEIAWDIIESSKVQRAFLEKSQELDRYFSSALDMFCITDMSGHFLRLNSAWEETLGYTLQELLGHPGYIRMK